jgi:hypothetical protein
MLIKCRVSTPRLLLLIGSSVIGGMLAVGMTWLVRAVTADVLVAAGNLNAVVSPVPDHAIYLPPVPGHSIRLVSLSFLYYIHSRGGCNLYSQRP